MKSILEQLKLPGSNTYTGVIIRKDIGEKIEAIIQLEFDFDSLEEG